MVIFLPLTPVTGSAFFYEVPSLVRIPRQPEPNRYRSRKSSSFQVTGDRLVLNTFSLKYHQSEIK